MSGFVQGGTGTGGSSQSTTISPTGVTAGNLLIIFAKIATAALSQTTFNFSDTLGNQWVIIPSIIGGSQGYTTATGSSTMVVGIASLVAGGSPIITVNTTGTAGAWEFAWGEYNGYTTVNSYKPAGNGTSTQGTSTSALSASLTPTSPDTNNLLIGWAFVETGNATTWTAQSGWTLREPSAGSFTIAFQDKIVSSDAAVTSTLTLTSHPWSAGILAITDSAGFDTIAYVPSVLTPPKGHGDVNKFGLFGTYNRPSVPFANNVSGSNTGGQGQGFPTGFPTNP